MGEFKKEDRYLVIKRSDIAKFIGESEKNRLYETAIKISEMRDAARKEPLQCVVVEHDWSIYDAVWRLVELESKGLIKNADDLKKCQSSEIRDYLKGMADAADENGYPETVSTIHEVIDHLISNGMVPAWKEEVKPTQAVSEEAIGWLYDTHPEIYAEFYKKL